MIYKPFLLIIIICQLLFLHKTSGQSLKNDEDSTALSGLGNSQSFYMQKLEAGAAIYTGKAYLPDRRLTGGHVFFMESGWSKGSVVYGGIYYEDIPVLYDLVRDEIIILYHDGTSKITLHTEDVDQFSLVGHTFIRLPKVSVKGRDMGAGFYDLLYDGGAKVLVKRTKTIKEDISSGTFRRFTEQNNRLYLKKGNTYYNVKSKGSVLRVFKDKKKELRKFLKENKIQFHKNREQAAVEMAKYYDLIN